MNSDQAFQENDRTINSIHEDIKHIPGTEEQRLAIRKALLKAREQKINLMVTGGTGVGKSSTINALFHMEKAKVGVGVDPETMDIRKYELGNLTIWDTPGLGDGKEKDLQHAKKIVEKLCQKGEDGYALIDLVLVIVDASNRDMGTTYELINEVIIKTMQEEGTGRVLVALNKADEANGGMRGWDMQNNVPKEATKKFLQEKERSVHDRIQEATGVDVKVISYKAGYTDPDTGMQEHPWNLAVLLDYILEYTPKHKRVVLFENANPDVNMWQDSEDLQTHLENIQDFLAEGISAFLSDAALFALSKISDALDGVEGILDTATSFIGKIFDKLL